LLRATQEFGVENVGIDYDQALNILTQNYHASVTADTISKAVDSLTNDGILYTTIDERHFHST
jgi:hypothetical protein